MKPSNLQWSCAAHALTFIISSASQKTLSNLQWSGTANPHMKKHPEWQNGRITTCNRTTSGFEVESWRHSWSWWAWCSLQCALQLTTTIYTQMPSVKYYTKFLTSSMHSGWSCASQTPLKPGWALTRVNFDWVQENGPKVGIECSFGRLWYLIDETQQAICTRVHYECYAMHIATISPVAWHPMYTFRGTTMPHHFSN